MRLIPLFALFFATVVGRAQTGVANPGFESGSAGQPPAGWFVPPVVAEAGYTFLISNENPKEGKQCAVLSLSSPKGNGFGNVLQSVDAKPFQGKRVRFRAAVRYERGEEPGRANLWLRVDRPNGQMGFFDNMMDRPITSPTWAFYEIVGDVAADAATLNIGMLLMGGGRAWIDAVSLGPSNSEDVPVVKPRALTDRGRENLIAFTRLLGYVRHFHPSDAVERADWNGFARAGVTAVEDARDPGDLAKRLEAFFAPLAPTVRVFVTGATPTPVGRPVGARIVTWDHVGLGVSADARSIYRSRRVFSPAPSDPSEIPEPIEADLGGGVSCQVPTTLFAEGDSALPRTNPPAVPQGVREVPTGDDRTTRLAAVALAWNVFQHSYPYFDVVKTDWNAVLRDALNSAAIDPSERAFVDTLRRMVAALQDGHGYVGHPSDDARAVPPVLADWVEGKFVVTQVADGVSSPKPGDEILRIDDKPVEEVWKAHEALISGATPQWRRSRGRTAMLAGPEGSTITLQVRTGDNPPATVSLRRSGANFQREKRPKGIVELKPGYWYVDLDGGQVGMDAYKKALPDLASAKGVVFDLRGYPDEVAMDLLPHLATQPITSAQWHIPKVSRPDRREMTFTRSQWNTMPPGSPRFRGKVAFITDGRAISYAESIMGIVEHYKLAEIVGEPTAGTNGNVNAFVLPGGYTVIYTGMKVLKHDGAVHHGVGIKPTVPAHRTIAGVAAGKDELLEKALEVVQGR